MVNRFVAALLVSLALSLTQSPVMAGYDVSEGFFVLAGNETESVVMNIVRNHPELTVDHPMRDGFELYGPAGTAQEIANLGLAFWRLEEIQDEHAKGYPSFQELETRLKRLALQYPEIFKLFSIGKSVRQKDLWVMKVSDHPEVDETEPEFKYVSSMHGDEITGRDCLLAWLEELPTLYYRDTRVKTLLDSTEIFVMPSMNPDGTELRRRGNTNGFDLNRDFPDFSTSDNENSPGGRQPETQAMMKWQATRHFALSANFHGGAEVVNYPWDTVPDAHPLDALVRDFSLVYSSAAPYIYESKEFLQGITNGYAWYEVNGGMQDWSSHWYNDLQVTIELSGTKYPPYDQIAYYYSQNREAFLAYAALVHDVPMSKLAD